ncbi:6-carboxytetrahydropterin synthase [Streptomyces sp. NRRL S-350]|uniref:6-carboxytetrahydropterin synthase n=1 Tax=Streptomyces sp. NRRL S-350 TaxID=1463902 RepID=UPI000AB935F9|nr:6-carboxytetrahydropterin synthase [Streptomyces sp. NRRL S-350]
MLTIAQELWVEAHHSIPDLPIWHHCHKHHGHHWTIRLEVVGAEGELQAADAEQLAAVAKLLESHEGPIRMRTLNDITDPPTRTPDNAWLAAWLHTWVSGHLRVGLAEHLRVTVTADGYTAVHQGELAVQEGDARPAIIPSP